MQFLKTVQFFITIAVALFTLQATSTPVPKSDRKHKHKPVRFSIFRWAAPVCGTGPEALWPRKIIGNKQCVSLKSTPQRPQMFGSYSVKWEKEWESDHLFMFGTCKLKTWSEVGCEGRQLGTVTNMTKDGECRIVDGAKEQLEHRAKAVSLSLWCDYDEPVDPGNVYFN